MHARIKIMMRQNRQPGVNAKGRYQVSCYPDTDTSRKCTGIVGVRETKFTHQTATELQVFYFTTLFTYFPSQNTSLLAVFLLLLWLIVPKPNSSCSTSPSSAHRSEYVHLQRLPPTLHVQIPLTIPPLSPCHFQYVTEGLEGRGEVGR